MEKFVVVEDGIVRNFIVSESFEMAEEFCGIGKIVVETEETGTAYIYGTWDGVKFGPKPVDENAVKEQILNIPSEEVIEEPIVE